MADDNERDYLNANDRRSFGRSDDYYRKKDYDPRYDERDYQRGGRSMGENFRPVENPRDDARQDPRYREDERYRQDPRYREESRFRDEPMYPNESRYREERYDPRYDNTYPRRGPRYDSSDMFDPRYAPPRQGYSDGFYDRNDPYYQGGNPNYGRVPNPFAGQNVPQNFDPNQPQGSFRTDGTNLSQLVYDKLYYLNELNKVQKEQMENSRLVQMEEDEKAREKFEKSLMELKSRKEDLIITKDPIPKETVDFDVIIAQSEFFDNKDRRFFQELIAVYP